MGLLFMRDFYNLAVKEVEASKKNLSECKDDSEPTGRSLLVKVEATHSGIVNGNQRFYRPDRMQDSVYRWTEPGKALKPVLVEHDKDDSAIGRIHTARYIDFSHKYREELPEIGNMLFYADAATKRLDLYRSINMVLDKLQPREDYRGLGYIELGMKVTNPDAIRKVLSGEYLTVSVGFQTDQAICSACHTDWASDDRCDHKLGESVDGKKMFLIAGNFFYKECSFVNFPADPFAQVISKELLRDNLNNKMFFMGMRPERQVKLLTVCEMADSKDLATMYESDIQVADPDIKDSEMLAELQTYLDEMNKAPLTKERAIDITDKIKALVPKEDAEKEMVRRVSTTLKSHIQKHNLEVVADKKITKEQVEAKIEVLVATLKDMSIDARTNYIARITEEAKQFELEVPAIDVTSLKLTKTQKDEKQVTGTDSKTLLAELHKVALFSFEDAKIPSDTLACIDALHGHYTAADDQGKGVMRYSLYANLGTWQASSDRDYAMNRLKDLEAAAESKDSVTPIVLAPIVLTDAETKAPLMVIGASLKSEMSKGFVPKGVSDSYTSLNKAHSAADAEGKSHILSASGALLEHWHAGSMLEFHRKLMSPGSGQIVKDGEIVLTKTEHDTLITGQEKLETQLAAVKIDLDAIQQQNTVLVKSLKKDRATTLVAIKVLTGEAGFQGLSDADVQTKVTEREQRSLASLRDALDDELGKLSGFTFQSSSVALKPNEAGTKEVKDKAKLPNDTTNVTDNQQVPARKTPLPKDPKAANALLFFEEKIKRLVPATKVD
jgi:hypothetical protein